ncbi:hypothetical protein EJK15_21295 [Nonomuraea basaltis]|nr:hypothetical protein EJK15_21295 [Nonomuraea basaltis]
MLGAALVTSLTATSCSSDDTSSRGAGSPGPAAAAPGDVAGFEEFPIGDDVEVGPLNVAAVYFQPVDMTPAGTGLAAADADMHIEADISALQNDLGYGIGDFVPNLTVDYEIISKAGAKASGTFMPMNASDGPHYGANIKLGEAGTYTVKFTIKSPEGSGFALHTDKTTGVKGRFWSEPLVAQWEFNYVPREW